MRKIELPYKPFPKQAQFHSDPHRYKLFGGAAGPGKSLALLWEAFQQAIEIPGSKHLLLRRTYPQMETGILDYYYRYIPKEIIKRFDGQFNIAHLTNGSLVRMGSCQHEKDAWNYQGHEYLSILFDEMAQFTYKIWQVLKTWNRSTIPNTYKTMGGATNPVGVGVGWIKNLFIDKKPFPGMDERESREYDPHEYGFTTATFRDNPIYANDPEYEKQLNQLPTALCAALRDGLWDVLAGSYFDIFDQATQVLDPNDIFTGSEETSLLKPWSPRWLSIDWGFDHPTAVMAHGQTEDDRTITYDELVVRRVTPRNLAEMIAARSRDTLMGGGFESCYLSHETFNKKSETSIAEQISEAFQDHGLPIPDPCNPDRIGGWMHMYEMLKDGRWLISSKCANLIDTLPILVRDEDNPEDILKVPFDDTADSVRYGLYTRERPRGMPVEKRVMLQLQNIDPALRAVAYSILMDRARSEDVNRQVLRARLRPWTNRWTGQRPVSRWIQ